jgi:hypothetical protein
MIPFTRYPQEKERVMKKSDLVARIMLRSKQIKEAKAVLEVVKALPDISDETKVWLASVLDQRIDIAEAAIKGNLKSLPSAPV